MSSLQQTGAISLTQIANEFGVTSGARSLKDFYRGGSNVSNTETVTSSPTNAPSDNNPVSNFAGVTGLTLTANIVTMTPNSSGSVIIHNKPRTSSTVSVQAELNKKYIYESGDRLFMYSNNNSFSTTMVQQGTWTAGTIDYSNNDDSPTGTNAVYTNTTWKQSVRSSADLHPLNPAATNRLLCDITGAGELVITQAYSTLLNGGSGYIAWNIQIKPGSDNQPVVVKRDDGTAFANNSSYAVTIAGATTETVQVGETITGVLPDSNNQYTCSYTPISNIQTVTPSPPTTDSVVSDFGSVTGLTCTRTSTTTTTTTQQSQFWAVDSEESKNYTVGGNITNLTSNTNTTRLNGVRISEGGVSQLVNSNTTSVTIQNTQNNNRNTGYIYWNTTSSSTAFTYSFTNNTGYPVVISGSGITTTTIPDGGTNNEAIANPNGNFTIQYEVANAQAKNGNIPTGGAISFTDFYGTEDFS